MASGELASPDGGCSPPNAGGAGTAWSAQQLQLLHSFLGTDPLDEVAHHGGATMTAVCHDDPGACAAVSPSSSFLFCGHSAMRVCECARFPCGSSDAAFHAMTHPFGIMDDHTGALLSGAAPAEGACVRALCCSHQRRAECACLCCLPRRTHQRTTCRHALASTLLHLTWACRTRQPSMRTMRLRVQRPPPLRRIRGKLPRRLRVAAAQLQPKAAASARLGALVCLSFVCMRSVHARTALSGGA